MHGHHWKGGRIVDPRGYVLLWMPGHHLADKRGYAYEHRVKAEKLLGRRLRKGEQVHHDNERKSDNGHRNLVPTRNRAAHAVHHRKPGSNRRLPGERNPLVACACRCGGRLRRYDPSGRRRRFLFGHANSIRRGSHDNQN